MAEVIDTVSNRFIPAGAGNTEISDLEGADL